MVEHPAKLHGVSRSHWNGISIDIIEGIVRDGLRAAITLWHRTKWAEPKVLEVFDNGVGKDDPVSFLVHGNKFFAKEVDVVQGRAMWASLQCCLTAGGRPRRGLGNHRCTPTEGVKEMGSWMVQVLDIRMEITFIGATPIHKLLPTCT